MVIDKFLPFGFFSSGSTWQELVGLLTSNTTHIPPYSSRRFKHLLVEMYFATKKVSGSWFSGGTFGFVVVYYVHIFWVYSLFSLVSLKPGRFLLSF